MRGFGYVMSYILTIAGAIFVVLSLTFSAILIPQISSQSQPLSVGSIIVFVLFLMFYLPTFLLFYFGHFIRKKLKLKQEAEAAAMAAAQYNPAHNFSPVQQPVEVIYETESSPAPAHKKAPSVSVECKGCGARKAVVEGESAACDYCGSPMTARA